MTPGLLVVLLAAAPAASQPLTLALPGFNAVNLAAGEAELHAEVLAQSLVRRGAKVMTSRDLSALLGLERQKQLLTCSDNSCMTEIVGGLGADGIVVGDLGHIGTEYAINVKVLATKNGAVLAMYNLRAPDSRLVPRALELCSYEVMQQLSAALVRPDLAPSGPRPTLEEAPKVVEPRLSPKWWALAPGAVAVAGLAVGALFQGQAQGKYDAMGKASTRDELVTLSDTGSAAQSTARLGFVLAGVGAAGTVAALLLLGNDAAPKPVAWLAPGAGGVLVTGRLP